MKFEPQVDPKHYCTNYDNLGRWISYWNQIQETLSLRPRKALEIGPGNQVVTDYLRKNGVLVTTVDIDKRLKPDFVASVTNLSKLKSNSFDVVICCQVLEHIPFQQFCIALSQIHRVTKKNAIISLPHFGKNLIFALTLPLQRWLKIKVMVPYPLKHEFDGQHYWEIGKLGYPLRLITTQMQKKGFKLIKTYTVFENPYHRFFILEKRPF